MNPIGFFILIIEAIAAKVTVEIRKLEAILENYPILP
jgi:hypothetical protein